MQVILCFVALFSIGLCEDKTLNNAPDIVKRRIVYKTLVVTDNKRNVQERSKTDAASDFDADEALDLSERSNIEKDDRGDDLSQAPQIVDNEDVQERSEDEENDSPEIEDDDVIEERSESDESPEIEDDDNIEERSEEDESHETEDNEDREEKSVVEDSPEIEEENISERLNMEELSDEDETKNVDKRVEGKETPEVEDDSNSIDDNQERIERSNNNKEEKMNASERLAAIKNLKMQLKEAKKNFKADVVACGIKHNFEPFRECRKCRSKCKASKGRKCQSCKPICREDQKDFKSKGCITDRRKIKLLRKMIKKIRGVARKLGDSKIFLPDL